MENINTPHDDKKSLIDNVIKSAQDEFLHIKLKIDPEKQFNRIAERLLNHYVLITPRRKYRLTEIEFYFFNQIRENIEGTVFESLPLEYGIPHFLQDENTFFVEGNPHQDYFTHRSFEQQKRGFWYLHKKGETLKTGNRKGIDLTIGNEDEFTYGGILIRALQNLDESNDYIYGPSRVVDRLISDLGKSSVSEISRITEISALDGNNRIFISESVLMKEEIYSCHRHGLKVNEKSPSIIVDKQRIYIDKPYRFFTFPKKEHAGKETILRNWIENKTYTSEMILPLFGRKTLQ